MFVSVLFGITSNKYFCNQNIFVFSKNKNEKWLSTLSFLVFC